MADNMALTANDIALGSLLAGGNRYGGAWGNGYPGLDVFAGPGSNAVRIEKAEGVTRDTASCIMGSIGGSLDRISDQAMEGRRMSQFDSIRNALYLQEVNTNNRFRDVEREMNANAREAAKCCCEVKLQLCQDKSEILAAIAASGKEEVVRELAASQARVTQLETIASLVEQLGGKK